MWKHNLHPEGGVCYLIPPRGEPLSAAMEGLNVVSTSAFHIAIQLLLEIVCCT